MIGRFVCVGVSFLSLVAMSSSAAQAEDPIAVPVDAIATVQATPVLQGEFDHFMPIAAKQVPGPGGSVAVPDAPDFTRCIANFMRAAAKRGETGDAEQYKKRCQARYLELKREVVGYLIRDLWISGEAIERGIVVSDVAVERQFEKDRRAAFPTMKSYRAFLASSGYTDADLHHQVRSKMLTARIMTQVLKGIRSKKARSRARARFRGEYDRRWKARTQCLAAYTAKDQCGAVLPQPIVVVQPAEPTPVPPPAPAQQN